MALASRQPRLSAPALTTVSVDATREACSSVPAELLPGLLRLLPAALPLPRLLRLLSLSARHLLSLMSAMLLASARSSTTAGSRTCVPLRPCASMFADVLTPRITLTRLAAAGTLTPWMSTSRARKPPRHRCPRRRATHCIPSFLSLAHKPLRPGAGPLRCLRGRIFILMTTDFDVFFLF